MKFWTSLGFSALVGLSMVGCASSGGSSATTTSGSASTGTSSKKDIKIAMIAKSSSNPVFLAARTGAETAAKDLSKKDGLNITVDWLTPPTEDGQVQAQKIAQAVNDGADAILISCSNADKVNGAINDAVAKNVLVMTFDSDAPDSKRFAYYGADDAAMGKQIMDELHDASPTQPLKVAILAGNQNAPNLQRRSKAVIDEAKNFSNVQIVGTFNHIETAQDATKEVIKDDGAHPEINAWAMVGGWPLFATSLLDLDPKQYTIVSCDALPAQLAYVDKGIARVLLAQPVYDWGYKSVGLIVDKIQGKDVPVINKMELVKVTKDNLGTWARQLQAWGLPGVDAKYLALKK